MTSLLNDFLEEFSLRDRSESLGRRFQLYSTLRHQALTKILGLVVQGKGCFYLQVPELLYYFVLYGVRTALNPFI